MGRRIDSSSFGGGARFPFWATRGPSSVAIVEMSTESCHERMLGGKEKRGWGGGREEGERRTRRGRRRERGEGTGLCRFCISSRRPDYLPK